MKRPFSKLQIVCVSLFWLALCYLILSKTKHVNGMSILMILLSAVLIVIPVYKSIKRSK